MPRPRLGACSGYSKKGKTFIGLPLEDGAGKEARTPDLNLGKVALYQLSYAREKGAILKADPVPFKLRVISGKGRNPAALAKDSGPGFVARTSGRRRRPYQRRSERSMPADSGCIR
jgi:hypothetical protein